MHSKQIALTYLAPKISSPTMIFKDSNIFKSILPWAKDSAKEFFATQASKRFLVSYIDDVAPIVDEYLTSRTTKMYDRAIRSKNKLYKSLNSSEKTVAWIIDRWINTFINLTSNPAYKDYIDISKIKIAFIDEISTSDSSLDSVLEFEKLQKLPKEQIKNALKLVWRESYFDNSLDEEDIEGLCRQFDLSIKDVFGTSDLVKLSFKKEQAKSGNFQLVFAFESHTYKESSTWIIHKITIIIHCFQ